MPEGIANVVGFDEGYVGYGFGLELWFSVDGAVWERSPLPPHQPQCEDEELEVLEKAITDGHSVILLGAYTTAECELQTFAWFSNNGRSWQFGSIGEPRQFSEAKPVDAWAIPGGWEAAIANYQPADPASDATAIWQSPDGKSWTQTAIVAGFGSVDGAADAGGNRLLSVTGHITTVFGPPASQERLVASVDGLTWTEVGVEFNRSGDVAVVSAIEPPNGGRSEWVLFVDEFEEQVSSDDSFTGGTLWLSSDLSRWETVMPPKARTYPQAVTSEGLIATACNRLWEECATYSTSGGREWTAIAGGPEPAAFAWIADGPAGVLAATEAGGVYRLVP